MSRLATARTELVAVLTTTVPDRSFASEADAGGTVPAVWVDQFTIVGTDSPVTVTIEADIVVLVDGADHAQVNLSDTYADALWQALLLNGWPPSRCDPERRLTIATDDTAGLPKLTGYRLTCSAKRRLAD